MGHIVEIDSLTYTYPNALEKSLDSLSLNIKKGQSFGLLGPNGAGKTTLLSFLCGQRKDLTNSIKLFGSSSNELHGELLNIGYAPQELALFPMLSGIENLLFFAKLAGLAEDKRLGRVLEMLKAVDLQKSQDKLVENYSGGMKRRLNLAVALLNDPKLLILDEPTVGVDPQSRNLIFEKIEELKSRGVTIIYTTHYMEEVQRLCDSVAIVKEGKILFNGTLDSLLESQKNESLEQCYLQLTGYEVVD
ncbi:hypothetical protein A9Q84_05515 [Halobacteriovorax marinus]|uniref:ABC transporter domain-containing protein n=1 Tax=Halobacteriovorax marinus TaxID=97084 RepID=A0A1Y5FB80_9BACT|nr:hypothetical protein A9Q84_05515 [Halobacteriovorax marinus]